MCIRVLKRNRTNGMHVYVYGKIYFKGMVHEIQRLSSLKSVRQACRLETQRRVYVAVLRLRVVWKQNTFLLGGLGLCSEGL